jgi:hypothetical protein
VSPERNIRHCTGYMIRPGLEIKWLNRGSILAWCRLIQGLGPGDRNNGTPRSPHHFATVAQTCAPFCWRAGREIKKNEREARPCQPPRVRETLILVGPQAMETEKGRRVGGQVVAGSRFNLAPQGSLVP